MMKPAVLCSALLFLGAWGCASAPNRAPFNGTGTFRFTERVDEAIPPVTLEGTVLVAGGEVELNLVSFPCRYDERSTTRTAFFDCVDVTVSIDRQIPHSGATYRLQTMIRHAVRECVQYATSSTGERTCVRYAIRYEDRPGVRSGRLVLIPTGA